MLSCVSRERWQIEMHNVTLNSVCHTLSYKVTPLTLTHFESQISEPILNLTDLVTFVLKVLLNYNVP